MKRYHLLSLLSILALAKVLTACPSDTTITKTVTQTQIQTTTQTTTVTPQAITVTITQTATINTTESGDFPQEYINQGIVDQCWFFLP